MGTLYFAAEEAEASPETQEERQEWLLLAIAALFVAFFLGIFSGVYLTLAAGDKAMQSDKPAPTMRLAGGN